MRIRLVQHVDVHVGRLAAGVGRRAPSAEACGGEIERTPEELDGTRLSEKAGAEAFEDEVGFEKSRREAVRLIAVVRADLDVLRKRHGLSDFGGHEVDLRVFDSKFA